MASHDLGALAAVARRVLVMYAGTLVETGTPAQVFGQPLHPYTRGLSLAYPRAATRGGAPGRPLPIPGSPPDPARPPPGCAFHPGRSDRPGGFAARPPSEARLGALHPATGAPPQLIAHSPRTPPSP